MTARKVESISTLSAIMALSGGGDKVTEKILAVQQMQDYIEAHLSEKNIVRPFWYGNVFSFLLRANI